MKLTTLCYIIRDGKWLMLNRNKKKNDENEGKYIGLGGKLEAGESPEDCLYREVYEEAGITLLSHRFRGIITFCSDIWEDQIMFLFTSDSFSGQLSACDEGELRWVDEDALFDLPLWEGDRIFLNHLKQDSPFFSMKLVYRGDTLTAVHLDGRELSMDL